MQRTRPAGEAEGIERWRILGIVGGMTGLASIFTPWFDIKTQGVLTLNLSFSPVDLLRLASSVGASSQSSNVTFPTSSPLGLTVLLILVGAFAVASGALIAITYSWVGGPVMAWGALSGLIGGLAAPYLTGSGLLIISMGPSWGVAIAFLGSFIVLSGLWVRGPRPAIKSESRASELESGATETDNLDALREYVDAATRQVAMEESDSPHPNRGARPQPLHEGGPTLEGQEARSARPQRFCTNCGSALAAGKSFCAGCGTHV
jgi:hypothetical protein